jgi:hypothetical protein
VSAAEIIEQIKALPAEERDKVFHFVLNGSDRPSAAAQVRYATDEQFDAAMDRVFENHEELLRKLAQ